MLRDSQLVRTVLDLTVDFLDVTGQVELGLPLSDGLLDFSHPAVLWAPCISALVSVSWFIAGWLLTVTCLGLPPPVNVVNRAYQMDRFCMPIWSFYCKTNIVILTCPSDMFPPVLPTFAFS